MQTEVPAPPTPSSPPPPVPVDRSHEPWTEALDRALGSSRSVSVAVAADGRIVFAHRAGVQRLPASNQKLLTTMTALDTFGAGHRSSTTVASRSPVRRGLVRGDLWLVGGGDPELGRSDLDLLASHIQGAGVRRIAGSVIGDRRAFDRGWWAPGWIRRVSRDFVTRPTALALDGNRGIGTPEIAAAATLTASLRSAGITVDGAPRAGPAPRRLRTVATVRSAPLSSILERQNHGSINFHAEMTTKAIGAETTGRPGSTASGARAIERWAAGQGIRTEVFDGSGLSHLDRISALGLTTLLLHARDRRWWPALLRSLPSPGEGTLAGRLAGLDVHAKTGTLFVTPVSTLSGYVRDAAGALVAFSVLSRGLSKSSAVAIEDLVVRTIAAAQVAARSSG